MLRPTIAALSVAFIAALAAPTAAMAAPATQPESHCGVGVGGVVVEQPIDEEYANGRLVAADSYSVAPGETFAVTWSDGYFTPDADVTVAVAGVSAESADIVAATGSAAGTLSTAAAANGSMTVEVTAPLTSSGSLSVDGMSDGSCGGVTVAVTDSSPVAVAADSQTDELAFTGSSVATILGVTGGAALAFGLILLAVRSLSRRHQTE
ncbi:hypothetical protein [Marisediminicola sp. LYQ134]|uniref:hypothetical protein n=1 Tax=unclassified Marisediminicola TaxID=2618316 RepID=UPI0039836702